METCFRVLITIKYLFDETLHFKLLPKVSHFMHEFKPRPSTKHCYLHMAVIYLICFRGGYRISKSRGGGPGHC